LFSKPEKTKYPPANKAVMLWDGDCSFCKYWVTRWQRITTNTIDYIPYQEGADEFPDLQKSIFKEASRLIDTDGNIYSGPDSAYRSLWLGGRYRKLHHWYRENSSFRNLSDKVYQLIAQRRNIMFRLTKALWGSDPVNPKPFWVIYLAVIFYLIYIN
jgi:predicted DCC family thiol-disulfide oxidoreductase YuxK